MILTRKERSLYFILWLAIAFAVICFVPFWESKTGDELYPLGSAYVNQWMFPNWSGLLVGHLFVSLFIAAIVDQVACQINRRLSKQASSDQ